MMKTSKFNSIENEAQILLTRCSVVREENSFSWLPCTVVEAFHSTSCLSQQFYEIVSLVRVVPHKNTGVKAIS